MKKLAILSVLLLSVLLPTVLFARVGVGIGTGKIVVDQELRAGLIYTLPSLTIINTGDEPSDYEVGITHREGQSELKPDKNWFSFQPATFHLEPGKAQTVQVKLSIPVKGVKPGEYFVFLEGRPAKGVEVEGTSVGIAAASKLYFTIAPSSLVAGVYYRSASLLVNYSPWSYILLGALGLIALVALLRRYLSFSIGFSIKKK